MSQADSSNWQKVANYVFLEKPEYTWALDEYRNGDDQMMFLHCRVDKWSKSALKQMLQDFKAFRQCVTCPLYAAADVDDEKWSHFVGLFGFKHLIDVVCTDGLSRRLFIHLIQNSDEHSLHHNPDSIRDLDDQSMGSASSLSDPGLQRG